MTSQAINHVVTGRHFRPCDLFLTTTVTSERLFIALSVLIPDETINLNFKKVPRLQGNFFYYVPNNCSIFVRNIVVFRDRLSKSNTKAI